MKKALFGNNIEPSCSYCKYGKYNNSENIILCVKVGVVEPYDSCKKFKYSPLKRTPPQPISIEKFDVRDFDIE